MPALVETVARHFDGSRASGASVALGEFALTVTCHVESMRPMGALSAAYLVLHVSGPDLPHGPVLAPIMGYHGSPLASVVEAGCLWSCALRDVLRAGLRDEAVERTEVRELVVSGQRYRAAMTSLDRAVSFDESVPEPWPVARARLGAAPWLTVRANDAGLIRPVAGGNHFVGIFVGEFSGTRSAEVRVDGVEQPDADDAFAAATPGPTGNVLMLLREFALLRPLNRPV